VLTGPLELAFDEHLGLAHPNLAALDLKQAVVGMPHPLPPDVDVDVLDGLGRDAFGGQSELAQAQVSFDANLVGRARRELELGAQRARLGVVKRELRREWRDERKRDSTEPDPPLSPRFAGHEAEVDAQGSLVRGLATDGHSVPTIVSSVHRQFEIPNAFDMPLGGSAFNLHAGNCKADVGGQAIEEHSVSVSASVSVGVGVSASVGVSVSVGASVSVGVSVGASVSASGPE
jgi:hypothetical protein